MVFFYEKRKIAEYVKERAAELRYEGIPLKTALLNYAIHAVIVVIAAIFLPKIGEGLATATGLGQTFVGNIFIAISTSLPEVVVSLAAVKLDAVDLAIGNLFGSNIFNIFILALDDIFFVKGPLLSYVNSDHIISALSAMSMISIAIIGLIFRPEKKRLFLAWDSMGILLCYILNLMMLYMLR
jgi:cation:H+ antiporter